MRAPAPASAIARPYMEARNAHQPPALILLLSAPSVSPRSFVSQCFFSGNWPPTTGNSSLVLPNEPTNPHSRFSIPHSHHKRTHRTLKQTHHSLKQTHTPSLLPFFATPSQPARRARGANLCQTVPTRPRPCKSNPPEPLQPLANAYFPRAIAKSNPNFVFNH